jgi:murein DD-endopeptidase MepM/ murein hydrolase activator NlpD
MLHLVVWLLVLALVLAVVGLAPEPAEAGSAVASTRRGQTQAERTMLRVDRQIKKLKRKRDAARTQVRKATKRLKAGAGDRQAARKRASGASTRLETRRAVLDRALRVHPNPAGVQIADKPELRKRVRQLSARVAKLERKARRLARKADRIRGSKQTAVRKVERIRGRIGNKIKKREAAEDALQARIKRMVELSRDRAAARTRARPAVTGFRKPVRGRITQRYGCTRSRKTASGRTCTYFHDGVDIAARRGTPVRASATGVVAYVGRNPWDEGRRAYVVILVHRGGYETLYGHLQPVKKVRAGQVVKRGQVIGRVGNTGRSTGPHVHWEVSRSFRTLDPLAR